MVCAMERPRYSVRPGGGSAGGDTADFAVAFSFASSAGKFGSMHSAAVKKRVIFQGCIRLIVIRIIPVHERIPCKPSRSSVGPPAEQ